jgi:circadian clock protein KaiC
MNRERLSTGIDGLDEVLNEGYIPNRSYLLKGGPGTGKTTFGLHFLTEEESLEDSLFITLDESAEQIRTDAEAMGFELDDLQFLDLSPDTDFFSDSGDYDLFETGDVEWEPVTEQIKETVEEVQPDRVFIDAITQLRHLSPDIYQFRKHVLSFIRYLISMDTTVLIVSEKQSGEGDTDDLQYLCDGSIELENDNLRTLRISKFRGSDFHAGEHHMTIEDDGLRVFSSQLPRSEPEHKPSRQLESGISEFDSMLHGGIEVGTVTLISGPTGVGKTTTGLQFARQGASQDNRTMIYTFEERERTLTERSEKLNIPVADMVDEGNLEINYVRPGDYTTVEFSQKVRRDVEEHENSIVMIDSLTGYKASFESANDTRRIRDLLSYLKDRGITVILIDEISRITGEFQVSDEQISHLADNIVFLRYVEYRGEMRKIIGVLKKRVSDFERSLREVSLTSDGMKVGEPQTHLRGVLSGMPEWTDGSEQPMDLAGSDGSPDSAVSQT